MGSSAPVLALVSAVLYGAADFVGGLTSRRASTLAVVFVSQVAGALALLALLPLLPPAVVTRADILWGALAGFAGGTGVALLYRGLAIGTMSVVAPTTAVCAVVIPVAGAMAFGERPGPLVLAGIVIALIAIVLVSQSAVAPGAARDDASRRDGAALVMAMASGVAIGCFYLSLARTSSGAGMWPLLAARGVSSTLFAIMAVSAGRGSLRMPRGVLALTIAGGLLDMAANGLYLVATRGGALSVIVTLASLYPASTVVLARLVLHERLSWLQVAGVLTCLVAIVLIVSG